MESSGRSVSDAAYTVGYAFRKTHRSTTCSAKSEGTRVNGCRPRIPPLL
jgi:hypothetical protein